MVGLQALFEDDAEFDIRACVGELDRLQDSVVCVGVYCAFGVQLHDEAPFE